MFQSNANPMRRIDPLRSIGNIRTGGAGRAKLHPLGVVTFKLSKVSAGSVGEDFPGAVFKGEKIEIG